MSEKRKTPNLTTKLAAALLRIKNPDGNYLISWAIRSSGTAEEICACVQWDHGVLHALGGPCTAQNLYPMLTADHREKSRGDTSKVAKVKRLSAAQEASRARILAKGTGETVGKVKRKAVIANRGFDKTHTKTFSGKVVPR